jgi:starch synthase
MVTRLVSHKGVDLVQQALDRIMECPVQIALLGSGDFKYENFFREAGLRYPGRVSAYIGFEESLAEKIYMGADIFLMPSRSEPCGLAQMIAMRYGTLPLVRVTGGLKDSVRDFGGENGNGYNFLNYDADDMLSAIWRALGDYNDAELWQNHIKAAMECDFSWSRSAGEYIDLYKEVLG